MCERVGVCVCVRERVGVCQRERERERETKEARENIINLRSAHSNLLRPAFIGFIQPRPRFRSWWQKQNSKFFDPGAEFLAFEMKPQKWSQSSLERKKNVKGFRFRINRIFG